MTLAVEVSGHLYRGVLCDLAKDALDTEWTSGSATDDRYYFDNTSGVLPQSVRDWAGLATDNGDLSGDQYGMVALTSINDGGATFEDIAGIIELEAANL